MESKKLMERRLKELWPDKMQELYSKLATDHVWLVHKRLINEMSFERLSTIYDQNESSIEMMFDWVLEKIKTTVDRELGVFLEYYHLILSKLEKKKVKSKKKDIMEKKKLKGGTLITARDILLITGKTSLNGAYIEHRQVRDALGKKKNRLTVKEYCEYWELNLEEILEFLIENR